MIDISTDDGLRDALRAIADWPPPPGAETGTGTATGTRNHRIGDELPALESDGHIGEVTAIDARRRVRPWWGAAAAAMLLIVGIVALRPGSRTPVPAAQGTWEVMAPAPIEPRFAPASAWTGDELIVWGGYDLADPDDTGSERLERSDGAAYDPATDTWRRIADYPFEQVRASRDNWYRDDHGVLGVGVDGSAAFVVPSPAGRATWDVVLYEPGTDAWRRVAQGGFGRDGGTDGSGTRVDTTPLGRIDAVAAHEGRLVLLGTEADTEDLGWATLDTATGDWSEFTTLWRHDPAQSLSVAAALDGRHLIVALDDARSDGPDVRVVDLGDGRSSLVDLAASERSLGVHVAADGTWLAIESAGDGSRARWLAQHIDVATGSVSEATAPPAQPLLASPVLGATNDRGTLSRIIATDRGTIVIGGVPIREGERSTRLASDADSSRWSSLPSPPIDLDRFDFASAWTGSELLVWGGTMLDLDADDAEPVQFPVGDGVRYVLD